MGKVYFRRPNGQFGAKLEGEAYQRGFLDGLMKGIAWGTARGVAMVAHALGQSAQSMWDAIRSAGPRSRN
jgi:hypothetical protein